MALWAQKATIALMVDVLRLRDEEHLEWPEIARRVGRSERHVRYSLYPAALREVRRQRDLRLRRERAAVLSALAAKIDYLQSCWRIAPAFFAITDAAA